MFLINFYRPLKRPKMNMGRSTFSPRNHWRAYRPKQLLQRHYIILGATQSSMYSDRNRKRSDDRTDKNYQNSSLLFSSFQQILEPDSNLRSSCRLMNTYSLFWHVPHLWLFVNIKLIEYSFPAIRGPQSSAFFGTKCC